MSISNEFIKWPTGEALQSSCQKFFMRKNIPNVIGAIDCTHITINAPIENKEAYFDRKQSYSIVLQAVVDADSKFIDVYCGELGSLHDSRVLRRSELYRCAESNLAKVFPNCSFLLADLAYPGNKWLVPPFKDYGHLTTHQKKFNKLHSSSRIIIENALAALKYAEHRNIRAVSSLVSSACVLHNICVIKEDLMVMEELQDEPEEEPNAIEQLQHREQGQRRDSLFSFLIQENII